jgi:hypothetical protein
MNLGYKEFCVATAAAAIAAVATAPVAPSGIRRHRRRRHRRGRCSWSFVSARPTSASRSAQGLLDGRAGAGERGQQPCSEPRRRPTRLSVIEVPGQPPAAADRGILTEWT